MKTSYILLLSAIMIEFTQGDKCENSLVLGPSESRQDCFEKMIANQDCKKFTYQYAETAATCGCGTDSCLSRETESIWKIYRSNNITFDPVCTCSTGYTGDNCEIDINECDPDPCQNAVCSESSTNSSVALGDYHCECNFGWKKMNDICVYMPLCTLTDPCQNNGVCILQPDNINYVCECPTGYTGQNCEIDTDECNAIPSNQIVTHGRSADANAGTSNEFASSCSDICQAQGAMVCNPDLFSDILGNTQGATGVARSRCQMQVDTFLPIYGVGAGGTLIADGTTQATTDPIDWICSKCPQLQSEPLRAQSTNPDCFPGVYYGISPIDPTLTHHILFWNMALDSNGYDCDSKASQNVKHVICECTTVNPCQNGATCSESGTDSSVNLGEYACDCPTGYTGTNCEIDTDKCDPDPCQNGGTCVSISDNSGYNCDCPLGYDGDNCEVDTNECDPDPCQNGATCTETTDGTTAALGVYHCACTTGFLGQNCELTNPCTASPCQNGATCSEAITVGIVDHVPITNGLCEDAGYTTPTDSECGLVSGYNFMPGFFDNKVLPRGCIIFSDGVTSFFNNDNLAAPCTDCVRVCDSFFGCLCNNQLPDTITHECACVSGYNGTNCEEDINECDPSPCQNGATCTETNDGSTPAPGMYHCDCPTGYEGIDCEYEINGICNANTCLNDGTCEVNGDNYECTCAEGWSSYGETGRCQYEDICTPATCPPHQVCWSKFAMTSLWTFSIEYENKFCPGINLRSAGLMTVEDQVTLTDCYNLVKNNRDTLGCTGEYFQYSATNKDCGCPTDRCPSPVSNNHWDVYKQPTYSFFTGCICPRGYTGTNCDIDIDECDPDPCQNGATCTQTTDGTTLALNRFHCDCPLGYDGTNCEIDINECDPDPCQNGATCTQGIGEYTCDCLLGYTGDDCEEDINECDPDPCQNGATCSQTTDGTTPAPDEYHCDCPAGFTGKNCSVLTPCDPNPCVRGYCTEITGSDGVTDSYTCTCPTGYSGDNCEIDTDECDPNPCQNGATCTESGTDSSVAIGEHNCDCLDGFEGFACHISVPCEASPCQNGATCSENITSFSRGVVTHQMTCPDLGVGYRGLTVAECEDENSLSLTILGDGLGDHTYGACAFNGMGGNMIGVTDDSRPSLCFFATCTCLLPVVEYHCDCPPGYDGIDCETDINECSPDPCQNGATCTEGIGEYTCDCIDGFSGDICEECGLGKGLDSDGKCNECEQPQINMVVTSTAPCADQECVAGYGVTSDNWVSSGGNCEECIDGEDSTDGSGVCTNVNECDPDPCQNGATCTETTDGITTALDVYHCDCLPGYTGTDCEEDINECAIIPSQPSSCPSECNTAYFCYQPSGCLQRDTNTGLWTEPGQFGYCNARVQLHSPDMGCDCHFPDANCLMTASPCQNGATCTQTTDGTTAAPDVYHCDCSDGYDGTNCEIDINECDPDPCQNGATCTDGIGEYTCECTFGYTGTDCEIDIDKCDPDPCQNGATCLQSIDEYTCDCLPGYSRTNCEEDINECSPDPCQNGATCTEGIGEYTCDCLPGYDGTNCEFDIDSCDPDLCQNGGSCHNTVISFHNYETTKALDLSTCVAGHEIVTAQECYNAAVEAESYYPLENNFAITNTNFPTGCIVWRVRNNGAIIWNTNPNGPGVCTQTDPCLCQSPVQMTSIHSCDCQVGYTGTNCEEDINECDPDPCQNGATCSEGIGEYTCDCPVGYDGTDCELDINSCDPDPCQNGATCTETSPSKYSCECLTGFEGLDCEVDVNECLLEPCQHNGICTETTDGVTPTPGVFHCACSDYFGYSGFLCDECQPGSGRDVWGRCTECSKPQINNITTKTAICADQECPENFGVTSDNWDVLGDNCVECMEGEESPAGSGVCTNINECSPDPCQNGAICSETSDGITLTPGVYHCLCQVGYTGTNCEEDINECDPDPCQNGGTCTEGIGEYTCECLPGYNGTDCTEYIGLCSEEPCQNNATCTEGDIGEYSCSCLDGYNGDDCEIDINECIVEPCHFGANCKDSSTDVSIAPGDFECDCVEEFGYTGQLCNECEPGSGRADDGRCKPCDHPQINNVITSTAPCADQECPAGFGVSSDNWNVLEGNCEECPAGQESPAGSGVCTNIDECDPDPCQNGAICIDGINKYNCECLPGYTGTNCEIDINECDPDPCQNGAMCSETTDGTTAAPGIYHCDCPDGYDGIDCETDIDECTLGTDTCATHATCTNIVGGYSCTCNSGFVGDGATCTDIDECTLGTDTCAIHATCTNIVGGYSCTCNDGFVGDGTTCTDDIDECELGINNCDGNATCTNTPDNFTCDCNVGFFGNGTLCIETVECVEEDEFSICSQNGNCTDIDSGFRCQCMADGSMSCNCLDGYYGNGTNCTDIDECKVTPDICEAKACRNTPGGFICGCETGYHYHPENDQCYKNICYCEHGEAQKVCQIDQAEACETCDDGFVGRQCIKEGRTLNSVPEWGWFTLILILLSFFAGFWLISLIYLWLVDVYAVRASSAIPVVQQNKNQQNKNQHNKIDLIF